MSLRENLRRGRSHLITAAVLLATGAVVVAIEDSKLAGRVGSGHSAASAHNPAEP